MKRGEDVSSSNKQHKSPINLAIGYSPPRRTDWLPVILRSFVFLKTQNIAFVVQIRLLVRNKTPVGFCAYILDVLLLC